MPHTGELPSDLHAEALGCCDGEPDFGMKGAVRSAGLALAEHPRPGLSQDSLPESHLTQL